MSHKDVPVKYYQDALQAEIDRIKSAPPDSAIAKANQRLLDVTNGPTWFGAGMLEVAGLGVYVADCPLGLTDVSSGVKVALFHATGVSWAAGIFHAWVAGVFVVDPKTIGGSCPFVLAFGALGEGLVSLTLYSSWGEFYGTFVGYIEVGVGGGGVQGTGELMVS